MRMYTQKYYIIYVFTKLSISIHNNYLVNVCRNTVMGCITFWSTTDHIYRSGIPYSLDV